MNRRTLRRTLITLGITINVMATTASPASAGVNLPTHSEPNTAGFDSTSCTYTPVGVDQTNVRAFSGHVQQRWVERCTGRDDRYYWVDILATPQPPGPPPSCRR